MIKIFFKKHENIIKAFVFALVPLFCAIIRCAIDGRTIADIYIPASEWNDELFYYKLTEGVLSHGIPQGYFGFNESHGMYLSFAAWSPVLLIPWVIWGFIFGWNLLSPIICNIFIMCLAFFVFGKLVKIEWKQILFISIPYILCTPFTRYMLSGLTEVNHWALAIIIVGLFVGYRKEQKTWKLIASIVCIVFLTWMRPYFILLLIFPLIFLVKKYKKWGVLSSILIFVFTLGVYYAINHYLSAAYLEDLFYTDWVEAFFERGIVGGFGYTLHKLVSSFTWIAKISIQCILTGYAAGGLYLGFFIIFILVTILMVVYAIKAKKSKKAYAVLFAITLQIWFCMFAFFIAILLMYRLEVGGRHVLSFIAMGIFLLGISDLKMGGGDENRKKIVSWKQIALCLIIAASFVFIFNIRANSDYDFALPYKDENLQAQIEEFAKQLENTMALEDKNTPSFDNTIVWLLSDTVYDNGENSEGTMVTTKWQLYYAVPKGFGINLCESDYIISNFEDLQCRYLAAIPGGEIDKKCSENGLEVIAENEDLRIYINN